MATFDGLITNLSTSPVTSLTLAVTGGTVNTAPNPTVGSRSCTKFNVTPGPKEEMVISYSWGGITKSCTVPIPTPFTGTLCDMWVDQDGKLWYFGYLS